MKTCFKCGSIKDLSEFYAHPRMKDGHLNKCKSCTKADSKSNYENNHEQHLQYNRDRRMTPKEVAYRKAWKKTPKGVESSRQTQLKWVANNPERRKAAAAVGNAIRAKRLTRLPCFVCGNEKSQAHHPDYSAPLSVVWLCSKHHSEIHNTKGT